MREIWKSIPGWEVLYVVSNLARVKHLPYTRGKGKHVYSETILKPYKNNSGYYMYALYDKKLKKYNQVLQHTIIAISAFGPKIIGKQVDHINNRHSTTYDNRLDNLQLLSPTENRNKFWNAPYRDNSSFSTPVFYISKSEIKLYPSLHNFCKVKNISMVYVEKMERLNKYIPKIKGFVVFIGRQYLSENR